MRQRRVLPREKPHAPGEGQAYWRARTIQSEAIVRSNVLKTLALTAITMTAFAANSVFCRMGLKEGAIDAASYTTLRLVSGAVALTLIAAAVGTKGTQKPDGRWISAALLFLYAIAFSFAYVTLSISSGALILFGAVQATMILTGLHSGERPQPLEWVGLTLALAGLVYLMSPGLTAPPLWGSVLMAAAGVAWGVYSLRGRGAGDPLTGTTRNFVLSAPMAVAVSLLAVGSFHITPRGALLAVLSGALASGCGYVVWYAALRRLTATRAATVQLSVPVLTALAGVLFLHESVSVRLALASAMILGGIGLALAGRFSKPRPRQP